MRRIAAPIFLLWLVTIIGAYYVVQKPDLISSFRGIVDTLWTFIVTAILLFNAYAIGKRVLYWTKTQLDEIERLLFGTGIGLGALGLLSLWISAAQIAKAPILFDIQFILGIFFLIKQDHQTLANDIKALSTRWRASFGQFNTLSKFAVALPFFLSFLLTLVPQFEAFDVPLYHLAQPAQILKDGGLRPFENLSFWFPNVTENVYLWALGMGSERAAQMLHLTWGTLAILLLWHWATQTWNVEIGRKTLLLAATIPSLPILASWAYADMALIFYALATLYAITFYESKNSTAWLHIAGIMAGFAMGVKYTSFTTPLACGLLILFWRRKNFKQAIAHAAQFSIIALAIAASWYIRNAVIMGNPFYPFVFGGRYWDSFHTEWYAGAGTGIGWNLLEIIKLPVIVTLGYRDETYFDGRMGPLFLALAPLAIWTLTKRTRQNLTQNLSLLTIGFFSALAFSAWTLGVINSSHLWQGRLLFPALIPFILPTALGWDTLRNLDTSKVRVSFLANTLIGVTIALTLFSNSMFVLRRNPLAVAFGIQTREQYIAKTSPSYAALIQIVDELPEGAHIYNLFEPRTYALPRFAQPDVINNNFPHDLHYYKTSEGLINYWKSQGYTHILINNTGAQLDTNDPNSTFTPTAKEVLREILNQLQLISHTPDNIYGIYKLPE
ncbi:MAG: glycosyltransferase family 39 protein [Anaerolineales bacterium]|nr:glycosyltransferase family 39 protein [Anaerolineales bacterium]